jgi:hypothetical protein
VKTESAKQMKLSKTQSLDSLTSSTSSSAAQGKKKRGPKKKIREEAVGTSGYPSGGESGKAGKKDQDKSCKVIRETIVVEDEKVWICPTCHKPDDGSPMIGKCNGINQSMKWLIIKIIRKFRDNPCLIISFRL